METPVTEATPTAKIKIKLDTTRSKLFEGRSRGIGFAFLKKEGEGEFIAVQPISPCKDYLNDVVYSEATGHEALNYGLRTTKLGIFNDFAYLAFASCGHKGCPPVETEVAILKTNLANMQKLINGIEEMLKINHKTELVLAEDNLVFAKIDLEWVKTTYATSLWALIARNSLWSKGGDPLEELAASPSGDDTYVHNAIPKIKRFAEHGMPTQPDMRNPHGRGIYSCP